MATDFDDVQKFGKEQFETAATTANSLAKSFQVIAAEAANFSKTSLENNAAYIEKLLGAKSFESAIQIQTDFAKSSYAGFIAQATKIGEIYSNLAKEAFKPIESAISKVQGGKF
jgi:hypothetical protein